MATGTALDEGLTRLAMLGIAGGGTGFNNANARVLVGDDATAADHAQTGIIGTAVAKAMDATFPTSPVVSQTLVHQATFAAGTIAVNVKEIVVDNGAGTHESLYRLVLDATEQALVTAAILATAILRVKVNGVLQ
jgi:hypothetical protein